jgi:hypothetical protein
MKAVPLLMAVVCLMPLQRAHAQVTPLRAEPEARTSIGGQWFLNDRIGRIDTLDVHRFGVDRGYIIIRHRLTDRLSGRITPDVSVDREGDGEGDLEVRLKYAFVEYLLPEFAIFTEPSVEFGLVHRPWLDFEEHVNYYRVQGTMFLERNDIFNSGDYGITLFSLFGGVLGEQYQAKVNSRYPGRFGSVAIGVYNGGGYHAIEKNADKSLEGRLTLRPLPDYLPGLQFSYQGIYGTGNTEGKPDWTANLLFVSWESVHLVVSGQYYWGRGNMRGTAVDENGEAVEQHGYSVFAEGRLANRKLSVLARYDYFDDTPDVDGAEIQRLIAGVAYHVKGNTKVLADFDGESRDGFDTIAEKLFKVSVEFAF